MLFNWLIITLSIYNVIQCVHGQSSYDVTYTKLYAEEYKKWQTIEAQHDYSHTCFIHDLTYENPYQLAITCPTDINCYLVTFLNQNYDKAKNYAIHLDAPCRTKEQLPEKKRDELSGVHEVLRLTDEVMCEFSSIETLDSRFSGLVNMGRVGGGNCPRVSPCPYRLKYLNFDGINIGDTLVNNSFCQFRKLEFLGLMKCGVRVIEADAFVYLLNLKELMLYGNHLTDLPVDLFRNNTRLETVNLRNNKLKFHALKPLLTVNSLQNLYLTENQVTFDDESQLDFPANLKELFINQNNLTNLRSEFWKLRNLTHLILWGNLISEIHENAFQNLQNLKFIDLDSNKIENLHSKTFENVSNLELLFCRNNKLSTFPSFVQPMRNFKEIYLPNNKIKFIDKSDLINCSQLSYIDLSNNELSVIEAGAFDHVRQLQKLLLTNNRLTQLSLNFNNSNNIWEINLDFNRFTEFSYENFPNSLRKLSIAHNEIEAMVYFDFTAENLDWNLTQLSLNNNKMRSIEKLQLPVSIQEINLSHNRFNSTLTTWAISRRGLINLRSVDTRGNNISSLCKLDFLDKTDLRIAYYISGNPLKCTCENYWLKYPQKADTFTFADLKDSTCGSTNPYQPNAVENVLRLVDDNFLCKSKYGESNRCECPAVDDIVCDLPCPPNCTCLSNFYQSTIGFMCNAQNLTEIPQDFKYINEYYAHSRENVLDLSGNCISSINLEDFGNSTANFITTLYLQKSRIKSIHNNAFDALIDLQILNLAHNQLEVLPHQIFHKLTRLIYLDLTKNHLTHLVEDTFVYQKNLQFFYLHNNKLSHITLNQITQLKTLKNISLDDNPWSCDCTFIEPFCTFLVNSTTPVNNKLKLNCTENGEEFNISNFNLEKCLSQIHLTVLIVSLTFGLLLALTMALVFKWRYELQVLVYARYGFRVFHQRQPEEEVESKQYDAFVAYNSADTDFLINELRPGLEAIQNPYRLCIHERDFPAGSYIQDSIIDAIAMSSRTIIVLSENFVSSGWCRFEFKNAHMQMLQDRCPRILVIVLGEVPRTLDPEMKLYLETNTYLKWGEKLFWQKLYYAMPDKRVTTPATDIMPMRDL